MSREQVLNPGDLIHLHCGSPSCKADHLFAVRNVSDGKLDLVPAETPGFSVCVQTDGKRHLITCRGKVKIEKVQPGAGQEILEHYVAYRKLVQDIEAHRFEDLGFELANVKYEAKIRDLQLLLQDETMKRFSDIAYGICRLAEVEPTEALVVLITRAIISEARTPRVFLQFEMEPIDGPPGSEISEN